MNPTTRLNELAAKVGRLEQTAASASIPGLAAAPVTPREPRILELASLTKLGTAGKADWFACPPQVAPDAELKVLGAVHPLALSDNLPADRLLIHARVHHPERLIEVPGAVAWKTERKREAAWTEDVHWRAAILPAGSFEAVRGAEAKVAARRARRSDPTHIAAQKAKTERARRRARWLAGELVELPAEDR